MLYASAQAPEDTPSLIVIGLFYGLVTYIIALGAAVAQPGGLRCMAYLAGICRSTSIWCDVGGVCRFS